MNAAIKAAIEASPIAQQAKAAKAGMNQLTSAIKNVGPGIQEAVGEQLEAQKEAVKTLVDERIAAVGVPGAAAEGVEGEEEYTNNANQGKGNDYYNENGYSEEGDPEETYEGGARSRRRSRRGKKISRRNIRQMASRRGSRRATRRRATRKGRRASRKAQRK